MFTAIGELRRVLYVQGSHVSIYPREFCLENKGNLREIVEHLREN